MTDAYGPVRILGDVPEGARRAVICFHHSGGSAHSFNLCVKYFPVDTALLRTQLPGRGGPAGMTPDHIDAVVGPLAEALAATPVGASNGLPFIFYGHSLGAVVAFELVRHLRASGVRMPAGLVVSGRRAPQCPLKGTGLHSLSDDALIEALQDLGGPMSLLMESRRMLDRLLPSIRADLRISDLYPYRPEPPLGIPILALKGTGDPILTWAEAEAWGAQTVVDFTCREIEGTHFFDKAGNATLRALTLAAFDRWIGADEEGRHDAECVDGA